uniref:TIL domain-containing protein n=1 Tax=Periophthalmus magnuspinnatus TaxID=409849 RepID=A0A3B4A1C7_9GOBI
PPSVTVITHMGIEVPQENSGCPPGSDYSHCTSACAQPSCQEPAGPGGPCHLPCVEGCVCAPGLVLSGDKCVPLSECVIPLR